MTSLFSSIDCLLPNQLKPFEIPTSVLPTPFTDFMRIHTRK